ncbi:MAG: hypothetical protein ACOYLB_15975 [Phototrophicaceae bacterium]
MMARRIPISFGLGLIVLIWANIARTLRQPLDWAEAQWLVSYAYGFIRRGLVGEVWARLGLTHSVDLAYGSILLTACALLVGMSWLVWRVCVRIFALSGGSAGAVWVGIVFATSHYVGMSGHLLGYYDHLLALLGGGILLLTLHRRYRWLCLLQVVAMLVHENYLFVPYPIVVWLWLQQRERPITRRALLGQLVAVFSPLAVFVVIVFSQLAPTNETHFAQLDTHLRQYPFVAGDHGYKYALTLTHNFVAHLVVQNETPLQRIASPYYWGRIVPTVVTMVLLVGYALPSRMMSRATVFGLGAIFAPLLLTLIAFDTGRIWGFVTFNALLWGWMSLETAPPLAPVRLPRWGVGLCLAVIGLQAWLPIVLMDERQDAPMWYRVGVGLLAVGVGVISTRPTLTNKI